MSKFSLTKVFNTILLLSVIILSIYLITLGEEEISKHALSIGYIGIFLFSLFLDVSFQIFSPDIFLISRIIGGLNVYYLTLIVIIASSIAGVIAYYIGLTHSKVMLHSLMNKRRAQKAIDYFKKYGKWGMAILAMTPIPYLPILGGIFRMRFKDFLIYAILIRALHFVIVAGIIELII